MGDKLLATWPKAALEKLDENQLGQILTESLLQMVTVLKVLNTIDTNKARKAYNNLMNILTTALD